MSFNGGMNEGWHILAFTAWPWITLPSQVSVRKVHLMYLLTFFLYEIATSVAVEPVFSQGRIILSHLRRRLSVQSTRSLMCVGIWSLLGYVKDSDIKAVVMLPEIPANMKEDTLVAGWDAISDL
jgi:hypothetical protein